MHKDHFYYALIAVALTSHAFSGKGIINIAVHSLALTALCWWASYFMLHIIALI